MNIQKDKIRTMVCGYHVVYMPSYVTILKSDNMSLSDCRNFCIELQENSPYKYKRTLDQWEKELISHIILYRLNLFKDHTIDTDLDEDESKCRLLMYNILYIIYKIIPWKRGIFR